MLSTIFQFALSSASCNYSNMATWGAVNLRFHGVSNLYKLLTVVMPLPVGVITTDRQ